jgi:hypothetical protein
MAGKGQKERKRKKRPTHVLYFVKPQNKTPVFWGVFGFPLPINAKTNAQKILQKTPKIAPPLSPRAYAFIAFFGVSYQGEVQNTHTRHFLQKDHGQTLFYMPFIP